MKKQYATKNEYNIWHKIFGKTDIREVVRVFVFIFFIVWYQCVIPISLVLATEDVVEESQEVLQEDDSSDETDTEKDVEKNNEEDVVEDVDKKEDVASSEDEHGDDKGEQEEHFAFEEDVDNNVEEKIETKDIDDISNVQEVDANHTEEKVLQENGNDNIAENSPIEVQEDRDEAVTELGISAKKNSDEQSCEGECKEITITNINESDVSVVNDAVADTGNNDVSCNGILSDDANAYCKSDCSEVCDGDEVCEQNEQLCEKDEEDDSDPSDSLILPINEESVVAEVITGGATSVVNVLNHINSNIVGTNWQQSIYDIRGDSDEDINLYDQFVVLLDNAENTTSQHIMDIYNNNVASVINDISSLTHTGGNSASNNGGDVYIDTGDALSGVNVVNIVNQNFIGNNWLFAVVNVFGRWTGDLIVPGEGLLDVGTLQDSHYSDVRIVNENEADVTNIVIADAETGHNSARANTAGSDIRTGDALTLVRVVDMINTNIVNNNWFFLMINNMGMWSGNVLRWDDGDSGYRSVFSYIFGQNEEESDASEQCDECGELNIYNHNSATIKNEITTHASTGGNTADNNDGFAQIDTGDAYAWTNIFNLVNNNIVGNNWMFGIVNVMNEWSGDVVFAYPDVEVSIDDGHAEAYNGDQMRYVVSYKNVGDAPAESVTIVLDLPEDIVPSEGDRGATVSVGTIAPGESGQVIIDATVVAQDVQSEKVMLAYAAIETHTAEVDMENNHASDQTKVLSASPILAVESYDTQASETYDWDFDIDPEITLHRTSNVVGSVQANEIVQHQIVVKNTGDTPVYNIIVTEEVEKINGGGAMMYEWDAGLLMEGESAIIDYAVVMNAGATSDDYQFKASAKGSDLLDDDVDSNKESVYMTVAAYMPIAYQQNESDAGESFDMIPEAQAYNDGEMMQITDATDASFWVWFISILLYALVINWTLFPERRKKIM